MSRPIHKICIDFDGVIYPNNRFKAPHVIDEGTVEGALDAIEELSKEFIVLIYSSRCNGRRGFKAVQRWSEENGFSEFATVVNYKPVALVYLDDRGIRFDGDWTKSINDIRAFRQWQGSMSPYTVSRPSGV